MSNTKKILNYFSPVFKKYRLYGILSVLFFTGWVLLSNTVKPFIYKQMVDQASDQISLSFFSIEIFIPLLVSLCVILFINHLIARLGSHFLVLFQGKSSLEIDKRGFNYATSHSYDFYANNFVGSLTNKVSRLAANYRNLSETIGFGFWLLFVNIIASVVVLSYQNLSIGFLFAVAMTIFIFFSISFTKKQARFDMDRSRQGSVAKGVLSDSMTNILNIKIFSALQQESDYFNNFLVEYNQASFKSWFYQNRVRIYKSIFFFFFELLTIGLSLYLFVEQQISIGTLVLIQAYVLSIGANAWNLDKTLTGFIETYSDTVDAIDVVTEDISVKDLANPEPINMNKGQVSFKNISFTYPDGDHVFEKFNLNFIYGQSVGIVGKSGSGKTTLTKLLLRFYDIDAGELLIDNQNITSVTQSDLRSKIAYIPQETILFHRSIYENIAYGNSDASREEVLDAAKSAHVDEFVENLNEGYKTKVGERGIKLSGGQRQRIGIARAMLKKDAPILVLDEATSSLDSMSEQYIQDSFEKLSDNRTTIVIAHRLSTIQKMDRILVMDRGEIIEDGSHSELLSKNGHYAELWNSQVNGFIQE
ncbi:MAG: ATP-binding cassette subfamily B protein [Crocinitomicaceae bacterium]|jgi:ATP-binding cassette subfamily B protein